MRRDVNRVDRDECLLPVLAAPGTRPLEEVDPSGVRYGLSGGRLVNRRAELLDATEVLKTTLDPYQFARDAYLRASNYFRAAPYMLAFPDARINEASERSTGNFQRATEYFEGSVVEVGVDHRAHAGIIQMSDGCRL